MRRRDLLALLPAGLALAAVPGRARADDFAAFVAGLRPDARARGVSPATFERAAATLTAPDPAVVALSTRQAEFARPIWEYLAGAVSAGRVARGRAMAGRWADVLDGIERRHGVPRAVVLAVWGMESDFGASSGTVPTLRALATLAYAGRRGPQFRGELLDALQILEEEGLAPEALRGSWAGAMGQTQFLPSAFRRYALDGDGDGRRDIWNSAPDALASTANFLQGEGWDPALPWGVEVALPAGFDLSQDRRSYPDFAALGARAVDGRDLPGAGRAVLFLPGGRAGPAFLLSANWEVIRAYNTSDSYALAVGHLADRLAGGNPIVGRWPLGDPRLDRAGVLDLQRRLGRLGHYEGEPDGRLGARTRGAVRRYQLGQGLVPDGYATPALLARLRAAP